MSRSWNGITWYYFEELEKVIGTVGESGKAKLVATAWDCEVMRSAFDGHHEVPNGPSKMRLEMVFIGWEGDEHREVIAEVEKPKDYNPFGEYIGEHFTEWMCEVDEAEIFDHMSN